MKSFHGRSGVVVPQSNPPCNELGSSVAYLKWSDSQGEELLHLLEWFSVMVDGWWYWLISTLNVIIRFLQGKPLTNDQWWARERYWTRPRDLFPAHQSLLEHERCSCLQSSNKKRTKKILKKYIDKQQEMFIAILAGVYFIRFCRFVNCLHMLLWCFHCFVLCDPMASFLGYLLFFYYYLFFSIKASCLNFGASQTHNFFKKYKPYNFSFPANTL